MHSLNLFQVDHPLVLQKVRQISQSEGMPLNGLLTVILTPVVEEILFDACTKQTLWTLESSVARR